MKLSQLVTALPEATVAGAGDPDIAGITLDSRRVAPGALFCCITGARLDGHAFAGEAVRAGAVALLVERLVALPADRVPVPQIVVPDVRAAAGPAAAHLWGHPSHDLTVVGVTGTNGKTTTTHLLRDVLARAGRPTAVLGTLSGPRTTPEGPDLQRWLADRRDDGTEAVAMEVSSHALALHRVDGTRFAAGVFTNLSVEHLDFHGDMERYFAAKSRLFDAERTAHAVVNRDDRWGARLAAALADRGDVAVHTFGFDDIDDLDLGPGGSRFRWRSLEVAVPLAGRFNVANALAAATTASVLGVHDDVVAEALATVRPVRGRFELVDAGQPFTVAVDYAHTPDALERLLVAGRELAGPGRVTVVFGCGGERDHGKRPLMGAVAARLADRVVVTADNSRGERTEAIIDAVVGGAEREPERRAGAVVVEPDRRAAITAALADGRPGDVVLIAGKGHETTLTIGTDVVPFDDAAVAREALGAQPCSSGGAT